MQLFIYRNNIFTPVYFSLEKFKNKASIEKTVKDWFSHEEARSKRAEIRRLIHLTSKTPSTDEKEEKRKPSFDNFSPPKKFKV